MTDRERLPDLPRRLPGYQPIEQERERFLARAYVGAPDECWDWGRSLDTTGYGRCMSFHFWFEYRAHRIAYRLFVGDIPDHLELDHVCGNRACVNPSHLEPVTHRENIRRGFARRREQRAAAAA